MSNTTVNNPNLPIKLIEAILEDEREYCLDPNYTSDEEWVEQNGAQTREEAFQELTTWLNTASLQDVENQYGDKYNHITKA